VLALSRTSNMRYRQLSYRERTVHVAGSVITPAADWQQFSSITTTVNHWDRPGWRPGRSAFYWYLTFEACTELHSMVRACQRIVARNPIFDLIPVDDVHMTLDRIAFEDEISSATLDEVERQVGYQIRRVPEFMIKVGPLCGSPGALSFSASPFDCLNRLRLTLTDATKTVVNGLTSPVEFRPHVGIAYCNSSVPAGPIIQAVDAVRDIPPSDVHIRQISLVRLTRLDRAYQWSVRRRFPLGR
jgi:2'-5' RNA ligase superfamily